MVSLGLPQYALPHEHHDDEGASMPETQHLNQNSVPPAHTDGPHHGKIFSSATYQLEVLYSTRETRVYAFNRDQQPLRLVGAHGDVLMLVSGNPQPFRYPLQYVGAPTIAQQDYLVARVDVGRIRDGDMQVLFDLQDLPAPQEPRVQFRQTFAISKTEPTVRRVALQSSDQPAIQQQQVCPVMGARLGEHGEPIKLLVGNETLYVCCEGCIEEVRKAPGAFVQRLSDQRALSAPQRVSAVQIETATETDSPAVSAQSVCPVMRQRLGAHGTPLKLSYRGRQLFVCCRGCVRKVASNPDYYFQTASSGSH